MVDKKKNNKYMFFIGMTLILVVGVVLASIFIIKPFYSDARQITKEVQTKQKELDKLEAKKAKLENLKNKEDELKKDAVTISNALPANNDVGRLFIQLDNLARGSSGTVKSVTESNTNAVAPATPAPPTPGTTTTPTSSLGVQKVSYSMPVSFGTYFNFKDFLTKAETALRLVSIDNITVKASESGAMDINATATTYTRN